MATTRGKFRHVILDSQGSDKGKPVSGARVYVYRQGTSTPITDTMKDAVSGGSTLSNPLTSDASGRVEAYIDTSTGADIPGYVTLSWDDNGGSASPAGNSGSADVAVHLAPQDVMARISVTSPPRVWVSRATGNNSFKATFLGTEDFPYADIATAVAALPTNGSGTSTGEVHLKAGPIFDGTASLATIGATAANEVFTLSSQLALSGQGLRIIGHGGGKEQSSNSGSSTNLTCSQLIAVQSTMGTTPGIDLQGMNNLLENLVIRNFSSTGVGINIGGSNTISRDTVLRNVIITGGANGLQIIGPSTDNNLYQDCTFAFCTTYGTYVSQPAAGNDQSSNNQQFRNCHWQWNGSVNGSIAPTGANLRVEGGTSGSTSQKVRDPNNLSISGGNMFGGSYAIDMAGAHCVDVAHLQFEMSGTGKDSNTIKDRPFVRVRVGPGGAGLDFRSFDISVHNNYFHQITDAAAWTAGVGAHFDINGCNGFHIYDNHHYGDTSKLTTANPLVALGSTAARGIVDVTNVTDATGHVETTDPTVLFIDAGISNQLIYYNANGL